MIGLILKGIASGILGVIEALLERPKVLIALIVVGVVGWYSYQLKSYVDDLEADNKAKAEVIATQVTTIDGLRRDIGVCTETNANNQRTIDALTGSSEELLDIIRDSKEKAAEAAKNLDALRKRIKAMGAKDNGPVAPVLAETIKDIQAQRGAGK